MEAKEIVFDLTCYLIEQFDKDSEFGGFALEIAKQQHKDGVEADPVSIDVGIVFGFLLGQMFDLTDPEMLKNVDALKKIIREKALLPYFPREKKAA
jgi:hypothetical protein